MKFLNFCRKFYLYYYAIKFLNYFNIVDSSCYKKISNIKELNYYYNYNLFYIINYY